MKLKRLTKQKKVISEICMNAKHALSTNEIFNESKKQIPSINLATIYRNLNQMVSDSLLIRFSHSSKGTLYEVPNKRPHHFFFCKSCDTTFEKPGCGLSVCIDELKGKLKDGFIVQSHEVYLHGVCASCAK